MEKSLVTCLHTLAFKNFSEHLRANRKIALHKTKARASWIKYNVIYIQFCSSTVKRVPFKSKCCKPGSCKVQGQFSLDSKASFERCNASQLWSLISVIKAPIRLKQGRHTL